MPLAVGDRVGHYEILSLLGQGGMGEVYRARDTLLKREVAIKVLPATFLRDQERMTRFQREAEVLASLDHPNIGHIYGIVDAGDLRGLVLALIEGGTLADRIQAGPIPLDETVAIAKQIVDALEYAHDRGIVHRDLKPANVKITLEDAVKVLDFGLAKVLEEEPPASSPASSPTLTLRQTRAGVILGTAAYMSPEQAVGRPVDRRSDIFSFGAVLYEMLTGRRAFQGTTTPDLLEAVVKDDPDWSKLAPGAIEKLIRRCLTKDRKQRLQAIGEARIILSAPLDERAQPLEQIHSRPWKSAILPWAAVGVMAAVTAVSLWAPWRSIKPANLPLVRLNVDLGAEVSLPPPTVGGSVVAISPDGTRLVYASATTPGATTKLFTRRLDQPNATELPGTLGAAAPFFSPDGQWVGFFSGGKMNKVSVEGGAVVPLGDFGSDAGASWGDDGNIFVTSIRKVFQIPAAGGPAQPIAEPVNDELGLDTPAVLPGCKAILLAVDYPGPVDKTIIEVLTLADHHRKILLRGGASPRYLAAPNGGGYLVYVNHSRLFAIPFNLDKLETNGTAIPVLEDVAYEKLVGTGQFDVSRTGTLVYQRTSGAAMATLEWVYPDGKKEPLGAKPGAYQNPSLSPDGTRVALSMFDRENMDLWVYDARRDSMTRLTFGGVNNNAAWSPDGHYIVFANIGTGLSQARADGVSQPQPLTRRKILQYPCSFAPDGKRLAYYEYAQNRQIWTVPLEEQGGQLKAGKPEQFLKSSFSDSNPAFSPDGRWLAYQSDDSGKDEVYVGAFPPPSSGEGGKWQVSYNGGAEPHWSRRGHELVYRSGEQIMTAGYTVKGDTFVVEKPRVWIAKLPGTKWDLAPDGRRIVVVAPVESAEAPKQDHEVGFLMNFFDELRRRVPAGK